MGCAIFAKLDKPQKHPNLRIQTRRLARLHRCPRSPGRVDNPPGGCRPPPWRPTLLGEGKALRPQIALRGRVPGLHAAAAAPGVDGPAAVERGSHVARDAREAPDSPRAPEVVPMYQGARLFCSGAPCLYKEEPNRASVYRHTSKFEDTPR